MRKKILSVLLALCMVLSLLPVAAFAAKLTDAQVAELKAKGYTDAQIEEIQKQIADYESDEIVLVFEDTTITEAESRLVVVVAPQATVTVDGAKLDTGIVVAPGATDAKIALKAGADVNAVVVLDKAEVVVEKDAKAANVTLAAAEAAATVEGSVDTVAVNELAEKATVTVAETAKVDTVNIDAAGVTAEIKADTEIVLGENAENVEVVAAEDVNVAVSGNSDALTESSNVGDKADEEKKDDEKKDETTEEPAPVDPGTGPENPGESEKPTDPVEPVEPPKGDTSGIQGGDKTTVTVDNGTVNVVADADADTIAISIPVKNAESGKTYKAYVLTTQDNKTKTLTELTNATCTYADNCLTIAFDNVGNYSFVIATEEEVTAINNAAAALDKAIADKATQEAAVATQTGEIEKQEKAVADAKAAIKEDVTAAGKAADDLAKAIDDLSKLDPDSEDEDVQKQIEDLTNTITEKKTALGLDTSLENDSEDVTNKIKEAQDAAAAQEKAVTDAEAALKAAQDAKAEAEENVAAEQAKADKATTDYNTAMGKTEGYDVAVEKKTDSTPENPGTVGGDNPGQPTTPTNPDQSSTDTPDNDADPQSQGDINAE